MRTVAFDGLDAYADFGLIRTNATIGSPSPKISTVEVEGMDGSLDLSEYFGEVLYENRELTFEFSVPPSAVPFAETFSEFYNAVHGKRCKIEVSEDCDFYYMGRVSVSDYETSSAVGAISVTCDCEPYKYRQDVTTAQFEVSGSLTKAFNNLRKRVVPTFVLSAAMTIKQGTASYSAGQGTWHDNNLAFVQGNNSLTFKGTGTVKVTYQERGL